MSFTVTLLRRHWTKRGHGGLSEQTDYSIHLNGLYLRGYSTHGNMQEGYWGSSAKKMAEVYAQQVADIVGVRVTTARIK